MKTAGNHPVLHPLLCMSAHTISLLARTSVRSDRRYVGAKTHPRPAPAPSCNRTRYRLPSALSEPTGFVPMSGRASRIHSRAQGLYKLDSAPCLRRGAQPRNTVPISWLLARRVHLQTKRGGCMGLLIRTHALMHKHTTGHVPGISLAPSPVVSRGLCSTSIS